MNSGVGPPGLRPSAAPRLLQFQKERNSGNPLLPFLLVIIGCISGIRLIWSYLLPAFTTIATDFPNYYASAWALRHGEPMDLLYDPLWFQAVTERAGIHGFAVFFGTFTPVSALVMWPLAILTPLAAKQIWTVVNIAAFAGVIGLLARRTRSGWALVAAIALLATDALGNNFLFGQFYIVLTLCVVIAVLWGPERPVLGGLCLAVATAVKLFPGVFVVYFAMRRQWRLVAWSAAWGVVIAVVSVWALGWETHRIFLQDALPRISRGEILDPYNTGWNSLQALLRRTFVPEPGLNPHPLINAPGVYFLLRPAITFLIVAASFSALIGPLGADRLMAAGILIAMVSLITPSQASYHYVLLIPGALGLIITAKGWMRAFGFVAFLVVCSNVATTAPFLRAYMMVGFWLALMAMARPRIPAFALAGILAVSAVSAYFELQRWRADEADGATLAFPEQHGYMEVEPRFVAGNLVYKSLVATGFVEKSFPAGQQGSSENRSSDGRWIVFATKERGNWDIALREVSSGETRILTSSLANDTMPVFSPDGHKIYFASDRRRGYHFSAIYEKSLE